MALTYVTWFCILYIRHKEWYVWKMLAAPGRMALTNYIGQSLAGMMIFYGTGLGLGAGMGLVATETVALAIFTLEALACVFWLRYFQYGYLNGFGVCWYMERRSNCGSNNCSAVLQSNKNTGLQTDK